MSALELHRTEPCATCPYRRSVKRGLWHASEFRNLVEQDANEMRGSVFGCHSDRQKPEAEQEFCVGWLLDQRRRGTPSIPLRMTLIRHQDTAERFIALKDKPRSYYRSIDEMCRANGVRR